MDYISTMQIARASLISMRNRLRRALAIGIARAAGPASTLAGHHGTAIPGYLAERIDPSILTTLGTGVAPVVLVIGANGKTTTTRLITAILERTHGSRVVTNRSGANLRQGIVTALLAQSGGGRSWSPGVLEVDELAFRSVAADLHPTVVVIMNLLRDQLDRYGEIDAVADRLARDLQALPAGTTLVTCADDPRVEALAASASRRVYRFGLAERRKTQPDHPDMSDGRALPASDPLPCPRCGRAVAIDRPATNGLGMWRCACGQERHRPDVAARIDSDRAGWIELEFDGPLIRGPSSPPLEHVRVGLAGAAGAHDAAAAVLTAIILGVDPRQAVAAIDHATPAFGRLEELDVGDRRVVLTLAKNPASVAAAAAAVVSRRPDGLLIGLADRHADGRDVSWIWDAPLDHLLEIAPTTLTGCRADDLALRFKYALGSRILSGDRPVVDPALEHALDGSLQRVQPGGTLFVLGTYTALLGIRTVLERRGLAPALPR